MILCALPNKCDHESVLRSTGFGMSIVRVAEKIHKHVQERVVLASIDRARVSCA